MSSLQDRKDLEPRTQKPNQPILALAPMAGFTDLPFRLLCKQHGADLLFSEMISATGLFHEKRDKSLQLAQSCPEDSPMFLQLFGSDPQHFAFATRLINQLPVRANPSYSRNDPNKKSEEFVFKKFLGEFEHRSEMYLRYDERDAENSTTKFEENKLLRPEGIDLNLGCPVKKVLRQEAGCALMEKPHLVREILKNILGNTTLPVSIKIRSRGKSLDALKFLNALADLDWQLVTVHARSLNQGFSGDPDWALVKEIKRNFPHKTVLANGGITDLATAQKALEESRADGLALARGVLGNPWLFNKIKTNSRPLSKGEPEDWQLSEAEILATPRKKNEALEKQIPLSRVRATALQHARLFQQIFPTNDLKPLRSHLIWYFKNFSGSKKTRSQLTGVKTLEELEKILQQTISSSL